jgi:hypothetical protein
MAVQAGVAVWRRLYSQLTAGLPASYKAYHPGTDAVRAAAKQFESDAGHKLPNTFKAFAQVFGPGELGGYYRIWVPGDKKCGYDLGTEHGLARELYCAADDYEQGKLLARLLFFASTIGGEFVGWDPLEETEATGPEYRVYYVTDQGTARAVAVSFPEFVADICLKNRLHEFFGWENQNPDDWPPQTFLPYRRS